MENNEFEKENQTPSCEEIEQQEEKKVFDLKKEIKEWVVCLLVAFAVVFVVKAFLFDIVKVDGISMNPTLQHGEHMFLSKLGYKPQRGDIIVLDSKYKEREAVINSLEKDFDKFLLKYDYFTKTKYNLNAVPYIKRIIGLPGDRIEIIEEMAFDNNGSLVKVQNVFLNGELLEENYIQLDSDMPLKEDVSCTVSEGHVFVMGDNRDHSADSRILTIGEIPFEAIWGKAAFRIWPLNRIGSPY